ncbi:unnamed protein product [Spodoptera littoralis]|uniref:MANSC domain-containing protein n=1 Tax=Spodoptera littoralis TaxID=7109 RepID=A0A9P0IFY1_SPOLI|nr:unnamed protein product [Spodoptera littoralis]CAH1646875.1 unnamed protein product [Spodoptera littoralis]
MRLRLWSWWAALVLGAVRARELDPAACASRFDVQRDKIIRTEESRDMGARYLSELDVGARSECLRLCCETDACDVFVYEEKGPGSCYLFNCGPPEDFRCKFTAHSNFSSGVLAISRRLAELQDQERLAHHEQELANLRSGGSSSTARTTAGSTVPPAPAPAPPPPRPPPPAPRPTPPHEAESPSSVIRGARARLPAPAPRAPPSTTHKPLHQERLAAEAVLTGENAPAGEGVLAGEGVPAEGGALPERWPHRLAQAQPPRRYSEAGASSHIFSHKGGLLQEPEGGAQFPAFEPPWPRRAWPPAPPQPNGHPRPVPSTVMLRTPRRTDNFYDGYKFPLQVVRQLAARQRVAGAEGAWGGAYWPEPDPRRAWPVPRADQEIPVYIPPKTMPEIPVVYSSQQQTLRDSPKKGFELLNKESTEPPPAPRPAPPPAPKPVQANKSTESADKKVSSAAAHVHYPADEHGEHDEHDGLSEHPPAAMMLLVLGLFMLTAILGMLTCRARAAMRRRRGRGKSPFAHDADYLVNGMYL